MNRTSKNWKLKFRNNERKENGEMRNERNAKCEMRNACADMKPSV